MISTTLSGAARCPGRSNLRLALLGVWKEVQGGQFVHGRLELIDAGAADPDELFTRGGPLLEIAGKGRDAGENVGALLEGEAHPVARRGRA